MTGHQAWRIDGRGGMSERIQGYSFGTSFLCDLCLQSSTGERNG